MIKLKEGQKLIGEDGNTYVVESGDCIQSKEIKESKTMKKIDTKKVSEKKDKVEIVLTKPYLIEGSVVPAGTKVLVESADIYDDFSTPSNIADASVPNTSDDIYAMRRMARMRQMDVGVDMEDDGVVEQEDEDIAEMKRFKKMYKMYKAMDIEEDEDESDDMYDDDEVMAMRRLARIRRMKTMRRMKKMDKEDKDDKDEEDKE